MAKRFRFAPSPTGHLHIGGARTALYNFLMAQKYQGQFILRIEDTDQERSTQEYIDSILEAMKWLGLRWEEGPFFQTERRPLYQEHLEKLLNEKKAYRCFCSPEALETKRQAAMKQGQKPKYDGTCRDLDPKKAAIDPRPHCIRFRSSDQGVTLIEDLIRGPVSFQNSELDDLIIARSNGTPTYNFVVVVDDVTMNITHIIRGDDHLNNTPRQVQLYQAFNYPIPVFAHVPMILGSDKKRLSKRHGASSVLAYQEQGYLPEALLNYLVRLGWSHGDEEIFSLEQLIELFDIQDVGKSAAVFNPEKLLWLNGHWIRQCPSQRLLELTLPFLKARGLTISDLIYAEKALLSCQEKVKTLVELAQMADFYFRDSITIDEKAQAKQLHESGLEILAKLLPKILNLTSLTENSIKSLFDQFSEKEGLKMGKIAGPLRVALTGTMVSPGIYDILTLLGKSRIEKRIKTALAA